MIREIQLEYFTVNAGDLTDMSFFCLSRKCEEAKLHRGEIQR